MRAPLGLANAVLSLSALAAATMAAVPFASAQGVQAAAETSPVSFTSGELLVIAGLLGSVVSAMTLLFRLLLQAKNEQLVNYKERIATQDTQLKAEGEKIITLLQDVVVGNRDAILSMKAVLEGLAQAVKSNTENSATLLTNLMQAMSRTEAAGHVKASAERAAEKAT